MLDELIKISGPQFIVMYDLCALAIIFLLMFVRIMIRRTVEMIPEPTKLSPIEIAYVKKQEKGVIFVTVIDLIRRGVIALSSTNGKTYLKTVTKPEKKENYVEHLILQELTKPQTYEKLHNPRILYKIKEAMSVSIHRLTKQKLLIKDSYITFYNRLIIACIALLIPIGLTKFSIGIYRYKPALYLGISLIVISIVLFKLKKSFSDNRTNLSSKFVHLAESRFSYLKHIDNETELQSNNNFLYGVALFGIFPFLTSEVFANYSDTSLFTVIEGIGYSDTSPFFNISTGMGHETHSYSSNDSYSSDSSSGCGSSCSGCGGGCGGCGGD